MFDSLEIIKENSHEDASLRLQEMIGKIIQDNEKFSLGLSGGSTPRFFYQNFANTYQENSDISLWTIDDRHVPINDEISNQRMINEIFSKTKMNILELQFNENPNISANEYSKLVIAELERLNEGIISLNTEIQDLKREIAEMKVKEDFAKELWKWKKEVDEVASPTQLKETVKDVSELKTFKTQAITVWLVVQTLFAMALALLKFYK